MIHENGPVQFSLMQYLIWPRRSIAAPAHYVKLGDILNNASLTFDEGRNQFVTRLKDSEWLQAVPGFDPVHEMVADLAEAKSPFEFAAQFESIRDQADYHRALIDVLSA